MLVTKRPVVREAEEILGLYFPVLDHGFVSLVDYMGDDAAVEQAARVSYGAGTRATSERRALLRYLKREQHTTPFEMVEVKFHMAMPMFVWRQWVRTRTANVNEYSGRYSLMPLVFYTPEPDAVRPQSRESKQGRGGDPVPPAAYARATAGWSSVRERSVDAYRGLLTDDVARELARIDLPLSTYTQAYWKIDLHNLFRFLRLRTAGDAQWEIRQFATTIAGAVRRLVPLAYEAWVDYDASGVSLSRQEIEALTHVARGCGCTRCIARLAGEEKGLTGVALDDFVRGWSEPAWACSGPPTPREAGARAGLKGRELAEFAAKFQPRALPDFRLDPSRGVAPEHFAARYQRLTDEAEAASRARAAMFDEARGADAAPPSAVLERPPGPRGV